MNAVKMVLIAAVAAALVPPARGDTKPPTTQPAATTAARLAPFLKAIRQANDARVVMRAYTRALAVDRHNVELHRAYMRRMLTFGLPQIAQHPARELVRLEAADGMAWGLIGYIHGRRGELVAAFEATMRAAELTDDDPSVLNNAGQLVAWHEQDDTAPVPPDAARRTLARLRARLAKKPVFDQAYKRMEAAYQHQGELARGLAKQIAGAEAEARAVQSLARTIDGQLQEINDEIENRNRLIDSLWREATSGYALWTPDDYPYYFRGWYVPRPYYSRSYHREALYERILDAEREIDKLRGKLRRVQREGQAVLAELARKEAVLQGLRDQIQQALARVAREFRWDPPAVDGVVAAERDRLPPSPPQPNMQAPSDPETEAAQALELAKLYLRHNMSEKALGLLEMVAQKFPKTQAARQAGVLLGALKPGD